jgi:hypothetical protein
MLFAVLVSIFATARAQPPSSFSCAISTLTLRKGDAPFEVCNRTFFEGGAGHISKQWITGTFGALGDGMEATLISIYLDGEATPSITYWPYELACVFSTAFVWSRRPPPLLHTTPLTLRALSPPCSAIPSLMAWGTIHSAPQQQPWGSPLFSRNSATSFVNNIPIPFLYSVRITLTYTGNASAVLYYQAHGIMTQGVPTFHFGDLDLSINSRLVIQRNDLTLPRLAYLPIVNFTSGAGVIAAMAIAFTAPNLNTLEGCFNVRLPAAPSYSRQRANERNTLSLAQTGAYLSFACHSLTPATPSSPPPTPIPFCSCTTRPPRRSPASSIRPARKMNSCTFRREPTPRTKIVPPSPTHTNPNSNPATP